MNTRGCVQVVLVAVCLAFVSCDPAEAPSVTAPESVSVVNEYLNLPDPSSNLPERITQLGRVLFYDKSLSANNSISCGSCHKQQYAFGDNVRFSKGLNGGLTIRNTMPLMDAPMGGRIIAPTPGTVPPVFHGGLFWDGRSASLPDAVSRPITNHIEMGMASMTDVVNKLQATPYYRELFATTFGYSWVNAIDIQQALAFFVLALDSRKTRFQQYELGQVLLTASELQGKVLFSKIYNCGSCHEEQLGSDKPNPLVSAYGIINGQTNIGFANIGLPVGEDRGLYEFTRRDEHMGVFRIPNLNNVALTAPYMHDGSLATLEDVLDHYSESIQPHANLDARLRNTDNSPMRMNISAEEKKAIIDFLKTFTCEEMGTATEFSNPFKVQ